MDGGISRMEGQPTRAGIGSAIFSEWRRFGRFLLFPALPDRATIRPSAAIRSLLPLYLLDILLMALLIGGMAAAKAAGVKMPEHLLSEMTLGPALLGFIVILAPIGEETIFRSWLSGRAGHWLALLVLAVGAILTAILAPKGIGSAALPVTLGIPLLTIAVTIAVLWRMRGRPAIGWFQRHFRWFYYFSALAFASIHLMNFVGADTLYLMPLVLPQLTLGLLLGYLRANRGLWASVLMHALHNALFISLVLFGGGVGA